MDPAGWLEHPFGLGIGSGSRGRRGRSSERALTLTTPPLEMRVCAREPDGATGLHSRDSRR